MRPLCLVLVGSLGLGAASLAQADDGDGLALQLPYLQGLVRLGISTSSADPKTLGGGGTKTSGASVLGDYYFGNREGSRDGDASGFRATTGVFLGSRLGLWGGHAPATLSGNVPNVERHSFSLVTPELAAENSDGAAVPYLGLGYSSSALEGTWGFSADLGLMALSPANARLGRTTGGGPALDEQLRNLRLSPVLQLGASYSF